jgi:hypothetical protein
MATREDVERLKEQWLADPCFDLADAEGFEEHAEELRAYQAQQVAQWAEQVAERRRQLAIDWGVCLDGHVGCLTFGKRMERLLRDMERIADSVQQTEYRVGQLERRGR